MNVIGLIDQKYKANVFYKNAFNFMFCQNKKEIDL
jgi:hypothetical protein